MTGALRAGVVAGAVVALGACALIGRARPAPPFHPPTILAEPAQLAAAWQRVADRDPAILPAYRRLMREADSALVTRPQSVVHKTTLPPSGNRHDYLSLAPYWWPDSTRPDGLPYIRRDGVMNPMSRVDHDGLRFQRMTDRVEALALAAYLTGERRYAERAAVLLRVFFIDDSTRMNPHLRYAQAVLGVNEGRGIGIIDTRVIPRLIDAIRIADFRGGLTADDREALTRWFRSYSDWLRTSENGREERAAENNHGVWYDAQALAMALFIGDSTLAREIVAESGRRITAQIRADGSLPLELGRTRPLHYSLFTIEPFAQIAAMSRHVGGSLWDYRSVGGASIQGAAEFIAAWADTGAAFRNPDVAPLEPGDFSGPLRRVAVGTPSRVTRLVLAMVQASRLDEREILFAPRIDAPAISDDDAIGEAWRFAAGKARYSATVLDPARGYPRETRADGAWEQRPLAQWTSGFFAGTLWQLFLGGRDTASQRLAERWTIGLEANKSRRNTHDLGFLVFNSFGHQHMLTGSMPAKEVVLEASRSLAARWNERVGAIKSWDVDSAADARRGWKYPVIVDNLMNLEMLFWAASRGGDPEWRRIAERHALTSARAHLRPDGSTAHVALFDPVTGRLERTVTWQGFSDSSAWARGQAWAIHGFAASHRRTRNPELLRAATAAADWLVAHLPADAVPYWDFRHPAIPRTERDASAAAIAASGLYDLARQVDGAAAARYRAAADRMLIALARDYLSAGQSSAAILLHSVGQRPQGVEIDVGIVYADYYFLEAISRRRGAFLE